MNPDIVLREIANRHQDLTDRQAEVVESRGFRLAGVRWMRVWEGR